MSGVSAIGGVGAIGAVGYTHAVVISASFNENANAAPASTAAANTQGTASANNNDAVTDSSQAQTFSQDRFLRHFERVLGKDVNSIQNADGTLIGAHCL